ncbi:hypothetical protein [Epilithonimonas mollis]|uniref:Uncharacterized protein n=1 Tax=Epilithonimonas mollis TaxID=216903 RepID=A0A1M6U2J0_9FLAO|nr:hypothetical protein [Epilithonimonas mollis]SHK63298.1 hypothetical protein SAMN05444371_3078 [Epilithonimonas mollis]
MFLLLGFKSAEELAVMLGLTQNTLLQPMKYRDFEIDRQAYDLISFFEGSKLNAYKVNGEKLYTIGNGSTLLLLPNGQKYRGHGNVLATDTISSLRQGMGLVSMSDLDFMSYLMKTHIKYSPSSKYMIRAVPNLEAIKLPFYRELAISLIDANYMSGSIFSSVSFSIFLSVIAQNPNNRKVIAAAYLQMRYNYIRTLNAWGSLVRHGWMIRLYANARNIEFGLYDYKKIGASFGSETPSSRALMIKKCWDEYGVKVVY